MNPKYMTISLNKIKYKKINKIKLSKKR